MDNWICALPSLCGQIEKCNFVEKGIQNYGSKKSLLNLRQKLQNKCRKTCSRRDKVDEKLVEELGISANTLSGWKREYFKDKGNSFPGKGYQKPDDAELTKLRKQQLNNNK